MRPQLSALNTMPARLVLDAQLDAGEVKGRYRVVKVLCKPARGATFSS